MFDKRLIVFLLLSCSPAMALSQPDDSPDKPYALVFQIGGGLSYYASTPGSPAGGTDDVNRAQPSATFRAMWHPDHRLRIGLETGWSTFYSYDVTAAGIPPSSLSLTSVPLLIIWEMDFREFSAFAGTGYYRLTTNLESGTTVSVGTWSFGWTAGVSRLWPISDNLGLGGELKWQNATENKDGMIVLQAQLAWKALEW